MNAYQISFYVFSFIILLCCIFIITTKNLLYAVFALLPVFLSASGIFILLNADFLAIAQIVIYVGGVVVLMIFGVMLTPPDGKKGFKVQLPSIHWRGIPTYIMMNGVLIYAVYTHFRQSAIDSHASNKSMITLKNLGAMLMTHYVLAFEIAGLLLLVVFIGVAYIGHKK
ncbi:MAG: NADH-quinone oxidoreductase subunit J [Cytophagaceae bacterium]|nr:NADH-quinone oxidoreductase subunit J [Cytophagaceae bacterium]MDW8457163.1 NADH-quinone oxidoreductase subunit J [Cytophagaceae bacterium]